MNKQDLIRATNNKPSLLKFGADFCQPCKVLSKALGKIEPQYPNVNFIHVDVEESPELAQEFQIANIPVMIFINGDGEIVNRKVGLLPEKAIIAEIENLLNT